MPALLRGAGLAGRGAGLDRVTCPALSLSLHGWHAGTSVPVHSPGGHDASGGQWSAVVAGRPHHTHAGPSASSALRWRRYSEP